MRFLLLALLALVLYALRRRPPERTGPEPWTVEVDGYGGEVTFA